MFLIFFFISTYNVFLFWIYLGFLTILLTKKKKHVVVHPNLRKTDWNDWLLKKNEHFADSNLGRHLSLNRKWSALAIRPFCHQIKGDESFYWNSIKWFLYKMIYSESSILYKNLNWIRIYTTSKPSFSPLNHLHQL